MISVKLHPVTRRQLDNAVKHPAQVYVFAGPLGSGKTQTALELAEVLTGGDLASIFRLRSSEGKTKLGIAEIHELIRHLQLKSLLPEARRVVIIEQAASLSVEASAALLKILEEPPEGVSFILITKSISALLPTVRSRSAVIRFLPIEVAEADLADQKLSVTNRKTIAKLSGRQPGLALRLAQNSEALAEAELWHQKAEEFLRASITERFAIAKFVHDEAAHELFLLALYASASHRPQLLGKLFVAEQALGRNVSSRLVFEQLAMELAR